MSSVTTNTQNSSYPQPSMSRQSHYSARSDGNAPLLRNTNAGGHADGNTQSLSIKNEPAPILMNFNQQYPQYPTSEPVHNSQYQDMREDFLFDREERGERKIALDNRPLYKPQDRQARSHALDKIANAHLRDARRYRNFGWIPGVNLVFKSIERGSYKQLQADTERYRQYAESSSDGSLSSVISSNASRITEKVRSANPRLSFTTALSPVPVIGWALSLPFQQKNIRKLRAVPHITETGIMTENASFK